MFKQNYPKYETVIQIMNISKSRIPECCDLICPWELINKL